MGRDEPESANGGVVDWIGIIITVVALGTAVAIEATRKPGSSSK
jgi:hypothetical protein